MYLIERQSINNNNIMFDPNVESHPIDEPLDLNEALLWPIPSTRSRYLDTETDLEKRKFQIKEAIETILKCLGEDPSREGLLKTPERFAEAMLYYTRGYSHNLKDIVDGALFQENHDEMVMLRDISIYSLCEHHLIPFISKVSLG